MVNDKQVKKLAVAVLEVLRCMEDMDDETYSYVNDISVESDNPDDGRYLYIMDWYQWLKIRVDAFSARH